MVYLPDMDARGLRIHRSIIWPMCVYFRCLSVSGIVFWASFSLCGNFFPFGKVLVFSQESWFARGPGVEHVLPMAVG